MNWTGVITTLIGETTGYSMKLITILTNANGILIAEQHPQTAGFLVTLLVVGMLALALYFVRRQAWTMLVLPAGALVIALSLWWFGKGYTYRVTVDQQHHQIVSQRIDGNKVVASTTTSASDLASAEMQFNRGASKIVLIHRDGRQSFPLGEQELQDEPNQYVILDAMRAAIEQTAGRGRRIRRPDLKPENDDGAGEPISIPRLRHI